jgi:PEP-CTERM motif
MISVPAVASNLVVNGSFEVNGGGGQINFNTSATGWTVPGTANSSYTFIYGPGTADTTTGVQGVYGNNALWGPGNGSANGFPSTSPDGGYFIAQDSDFQNSPIQQTISGLTVGNSYTVGFWWAAAQQYTFNGPNQSQWQVSLGSQTQSTAFDSISSHGFSGWMYQTFTYTATSSSEVLSFFANGSPAVPPFALLDGVTLNASTPEPGTLALLGSGLLGAVGFARRYHSKKRD